MMGHLPEAGIAYCSPELINEYRFEAEHQYHKRSARRSNSKNTLATIVDNGEAIGEAGGNGNRSGNGGGGAKDLEIGRVERGDKEGGGGGGGKDSALKVTCRRCDSLVPKDDTVYCPYMSHDVCDEKHRAECEAREEKNRTKRQRSSKYAR